MLLCHVYVTKYGKRALCLHARWRPSRLPLDPTTRTCSLPSNQQVQSTFSKPSLRNRISCLSTKIPRPEMHLSWGTVRRRWISRTPSRRSFCLCTVHRHRLWRQPFVRWWRTPTLTQRWVLLHQRRHRRTVIRNGDAAPTSSCPRCWRTTRNWSWTPPPQVSDRIQRAAVGHVSFTDANPGARHRSCWQRWGESSSTTPTDSGILHPGCGCRSVLSVIEACELSCSLNWDYDTCDLFLVITCINIDILCYAACAMCKRSQAPQMTPVRDYRW